MHNYRRQDWTDKFPDNVCTTTAVYGFAKNDKYLDARCIEQLPSTLEDPVDVKFLAVTPNIYERGENAYFRYELDPFRKVQPRRYNPETTPVNE